MPNPVRFAKVKRLLERDGWVLHRISGSHHVFKKPGRPNIVLPVHGGKVKAAYVKQIEEEIEQSD